MTNSRVITRANVGDMIGAWLVLEVEKATTGTEVGRTRYLTRCPKCKRGKGYAVPSNCAKQAAAAHAPTRSEE